MTTYTVTETRPTSSIAFISDDSRYSGMAEDLTNELAAAGITTTVETSTDGLVKTHRRSMTEDKILVFKEIYDRFNLELGTLKIANNDQGWGLLTEGADPATDVVVRRGFYNQRDEQIYSGEIVL
jgi:hypothetical protein